MSNAERWAIAGSIAGVLSVLIAIAAWQWPTSSTAVVPTPTPTIALVTSLAPEPTYTTPEPGPTTVSTTPIVVVTSTSPLIPTTTAPSVGVQWQGALRVNDFGLLLSTSPPSPAQAYPDIEPYAGGTMVTPHGAAQWTDSRDPSAQDCAGLVAAQNATRFTVTRGEHFCVRVAQYGESAVDLGQQYAYVQINGTGSSPSSLNYVDVYAVVWAPLS